MTFGLIPYAGLSRETFAFSFETSNIHFTVDIPISPRIYVGLPKWKNLFKVEIIIHTKNAITEYSQHFNSVELGATYYKLFEQQDVAKWVNDTHKKPFLFCPKMYRGITDSGGLGGKENITLGYLNSISIFKEKLGPVLIQLREKFGPSRLLEITHFLKSLPTSIQFFLELRHQEWFEKSMYRKLLLQSLHELNVGAVITDTPGNRSFVHMDFPIPKAYIRFVCTGDNELDYYRIDEWRRYLKLLINNGLREVYFFLHIHNQLEVLNFSRHVQREFGTLLL